MGWNRYDVISRGLLLFGMWFLAAGVAGLLLPNRFPVAGAPGLGATALATATAAVGLFAVVVGFRVFARRAESAVDLALSAEQVAERWEQH